MKDTGIEKYLLRKAFDSENVLRWSALPLFPKKYCGAQKKPSATELALKKNHGFK